MMCGTLRNPIILLNKGSTCLIAAVIQPEGTYLAPRLLPTTTYYFYYYYAYYYHYGY